MSRQCPTCGARELHHSRLRTPAERVRWRLTGRVPFRCHGCDWRGWLREEAKPAKSGPRRVHRGLTDAELERLDPGHRRRS